MFSVMLWIIWLLIGIAKVSGLTIRTFANQNCSLPVVHENEIKIDECLPHDTIANSWTKIKCVDAEENEEDGLYVNIQSYDNDRCRGTISHNYGSVSLFSAYVANAPGSSIIVRYKADVCSTPFLGENEEYSISYICTELKQTEEESSSVLSIIAWLFIVCILICCCLIILGQVTKDD